jgi:hypothetical protein
LAELLDGFNKCAVGWPRPEGSISRRQTGHAGSERLFVQGIGDLRARLAISCPRQPRSIQAYYFASLAAGASVFFASPAFLSSSPLWW